MRRGQHTAKNQELIAVIRRTRIDVSYLYETERLLDEKIGFMAEHCRRVVDFGKSSRERYALFKPGQVLTVDINQFDDYPDVIDDLCNITSLSWGTFDGIVCMAVLEHVYAPHAAVGNLHRLLVDGGYCLVYAPYLWQYHAPKDLSYQDYFRFSRDALAYLFRDFSDVTIYPCRGQYSTILNLFGFWKLKVERRLGQRLNRVVDSLLGKALGRNDEVQASGYFLWARK